MIVFIKDAETRVLCVSLGKLLRYAGAGALAAAILVAIAQQLLGAIALQYATVLAIVGLASFHLSYILLGYLFTSPVYLVDVACFGPPQQ